MAPHYQLLLPEQTPAPVLSAAQQRVVEHESGPLLVLAGPGTGKTTTLVEAAAHRLSRRALRAEELLVLTFSRKAAQQLRDRISARVGRASATGLGTTFHSFAYALVREFSDDEAYSTPLRLLSSAEQDVTIRELLRGRPDRWPPELAQAVTTKGFAQEVAGLLARSQEKGLGYVALAQLGAREDRPDLVAAAQFLAEYDDVLAAQNALDYPTLIAQAVALAQGSAYAQLAGRYHTILVDEYQDTDPAQVALLRALQPAELIVVGDPHQSIYGFRGAQVRGIMEFPTSFPDSRGNPAEVVALTEGRRMRPLIAKAAARVAGRLPLPAGLSEQTRHDFIGSSRPTAEAGEAHSVADFPQVAVVTFDSERAEAEHIADRLRRAHLEHQIPYSEMAVLVRSGRNQIPRLRRGLAQAGVPIEVSADETALAAEPALAPLLGCLNWVVHGSSWLDETRVRGLLASPLVGLGAADLRAWAKWLRVREREVAAAEQRLPRSSAELMVAAFTDPDSQLPEWDHAEAANVVRFLAVIAEARALAERNATPYEVLWTLWSGTPWPERLQRDALAAGRSSRAAHRDLDAIVALFDAAAKLERRAGFLGLGAFVSSLEAQQLPADSVSERGVRGGAVRVLTAHRAKGLQWRYVVIAGVNDEVWPDLRRHSTLLPPVEVTADGLATESSRAADLLEERRLFYVALTRASDHLLVTAVAETDEDGAQPSRFLAELDVPVQHVAGRPERPLSLPGLIAGLRRTLSDPAQSESLRQAAVLRLRRIEAEAGLAGRGASPETWWGLAELTGSTPVPEEVPALTASSLTDLVACPARWFFESRVGATRDSTQAQGFGNVVHTLAERIGRGELATTPEALAEAMAEVDQVWGQIPFRTPWSSGRERAELEAAIARFVTWHQRANARQLVAVEQRLSAEVRLESGQRVRLYGYADRLELDAEGRVVVIDLKTAKKSSERVSAEDHPQLGLYQLAVANGAVDNLVATDQRPAVPGGAELVQLRQQSRGQPKTVRQEPLPAEATQAPAAGVAIWEQLDDATQTLQQQRWHARTGKHCEYCQFESLCPAQVAGTVLS